MIILSTNYINVKGGDTEYAIYSTTWYDERPENIHAKTMIIQRCQNYPQSP